MNRNKSLSGLSSTIPEISGMLNKKEWGGAVEFFMEAKIFEDIEQKKRGILSNDPSPSPLEGKELIHIYVKKL